ncbi:uncharacterized protein LOC139923874 [Centroberyx gerrardi]|uniref:uncharacterized protein n=1 Tax=Centroberyx gerrardi TaxID=166262 RepID=UPI003AAD8774
MGLTIWLCVLCLQASLLSHALDCSGATQGERCVSGPLADGQYDDVKQQRALPSAGTARKQTPLMVRRKRQLERRGPTHLSHPGLPGAVSVKGFPNTLIQADRARRHLAQAGNKKKNKRKSRVGSFSLLSNNTPSAPLQVTRARRQLKNEPAKRGKTGRSGAYSILGDPQSEGQNDRPKRSVQKKRAARNVCS